MHANVGRYEQIHAQEREKLLCEYNCKNNMQTTQANDDRKNANATTNAQNSLNYSAAHKYALSAKVLARPPLQAQNANYTR